LLFFIQSVNEDFQIVEELLELVPMKGKIGGTDKVFSESVKHSYNYELSWVGGVERLGLLVMGCWL
jgi:hypothetical protein